MKGQLHEQDEDLLNLTARGKSAGKSKEGGAGLSGFDGSPSRSPLGPNSLLQLQRLAGNAAVTKLMTQSGGQAPLTIQRLKDDGSHDVEDDGEVDDVEEPKAQEYDRSRVPTRGNIAFETGKPTAVIGGAMGGGLGSGNVGIGSEIIGGANLLDAAMTIRSGYSRSRKKDDRAGVSLGESQMRTGGWGLGGGAVSSTEAGVNVGKAAGSHLAGLGVGAAGLGVVGGGITTLQGLWKMYKATGKLMELGRRSMLTADGHRWKERVGNREKWKLGVGALKVALGVLGIAAGALLIGSNPVGWALGIAAAAAGGAWALTKIAGKIRNLWERRKAKKEIEKRDPKGAKRKEAKVLADQVARECSTNARVAGEMVVALGTGDATVVAARNRAIEKMDAMVGKAQGVELPRPTENDKRAHDSFSLLGVLNISPEEAQSLSGQERIEKKLSVAESA